MLCARSQQELCPELYSNPHLINNSVLLYTCIYTCKSLSLLYVPSASSLIPFNRQLLYVSYEK